MKGERVAQLALVAAGYYVSARLGLQLAVVSEIVTPLWPPTGVAVVALAAFGYGVWPAVAIAAFAVNAPIAASPAVALAIALGNTVAPVAAVALLRRFNFDSHLARLRDAIVLVAVALASMAISATVGTAAIKAGGATASVHDAWWVWWTGDAVGVLIVAPVLWALTNAGRSVKVEWARATEAALLLGAVGVAAYAAPRLEEGALFVVLPVLGWTAWRFQQPGAAPAGLIASSLVILAAADDQGIFAGDSLLQRMAVLQGFNACVALTSFVFAAAVTERRVMHEALIEREHRIAVGLQRSFLPTELPLIAGVQMAARYRPAGKESEVGGDWYDVITFGDDSVALVVGDVAGHGIASAAAMAQLRTGVRAHALARRGPTGTVEAVNRMALELHPGTMATLLYIEFDADKAEIRIANAGHPPPLLIGPDGDAHYLTAPANPPVGVELLLNCSESTHPLPTDSTLVLFTDGLVERRDNALDEALERLRSSMSTVGATLDVEAVCERIMQSLSDSERNDDVALLVFRPTSLAGVRLELDRPAVPTAVAEVRHTIGRWLKANGATREETFDVVLACTEAYTNAVRHAYRGPDGRVFVSGEIDDGTALVTVRDHGTWREASATPGLGGRGLVLIRRLVDTDIRSGPTGTEVRMSRRLGTPQIHAAATGSGRE